MIRKFQRQDLEAAVSEKRFRQDLLYRLHDFVITVPPLRDCQEDIMPLAEFFREVANKELECNVSGFSSETRKALLTHAWPGQRAGTFCRSSRTLPGHACVSNALRASELNPLTLHSSSLFAISRKNSASGIMSS